ncbi:hypothetical protein [Ferrimicrobium acidiphilum]|uniref:hypothetical protein n=1 Tax=Ferrimicrobium acidiphilum TaxID=121039 RepID=UPI0023F22C15|nr:hypothetical protein [Ferrimicrobium acidiphilum]
MKLERISTFIVFNDERIKFIALSIGLSAVIAAGWCVIGSLSEFKAAEAIILVELCIVSLFRVNRRLWSWTQTRVIAQRSSKESPREREAIRAETVVLGQEPDAGVVRAGTARLKRLRSSKQSDFGMLFSGIAENVFRVPNGVRFAFTVLGIVGFVCGCVDLTLERRIKRNLGTTTARD